MDFLFEKAKSPLDPAVGVGGAIYPGIESDRGKYNFYTISLGDNN